MIFAVVNDTCCLVQLIALEYKPDFYSVRSALYITFELHWIMN